MNTGSDHYLFSGFWDHRLDGKDRVVIPAEFAGQIAAHASNEVYLVPGKEGPYVEVYPRDVFLALGRRYVSNPFEGPMGATRTFFGNAQKCSLQGPGRVAIPKRWADRFPRRVVRIVGVVDHLELWDPEQSAGHGVGAEAGPATPLSPEG